MNRPARRRPSLLLRLLMLVVVACGTVGGTTASALGELHAMSHLDHPVAAHDDASLPQSAHDREEPGARLLHALLHCGHCHGQGSVLPFAVMTWELPAAPAGALPHAGGSDWRAAPLESLLRPPIQA